MIKPKQFIQADAASRRGLVQALGCFGSADICNGSLTINGGTPAVGRTQITEAAQGFMTAFPDLKVYMDDLIEQGDKIIYKWTIEGINRGPGGTGNRVRISGFEEWRISDDGLVAESLGNYDAADYQRQGDGTGGK